MTWRNHSKETDAVYQCLAVVFAIHLAIGLYLIAGMESAENTARAKVEFVKQMAQMDDVSDTATKRAVKEYGR